MLVCSQARPCIICEGNATIILERTNSVEVITELSGGGAGIQAGLTGSTLTIRGSGSLTATGSYGAAGIGCSRDGSCGTITIGGTTYYNGTNFLNGGETILSQDPYTYEPPNP